jgi:hypothetical protein
MPTRNREFVRFMEVPSSFLNAGQDSYLTQRATGISNTLAGGLNVESATTRRREAVYCADKPPSGFNPLEVDAFDWRDRNIEVSLSFDLTEDIRPGENRDDIVPGYRARSSYYTRLGGDLLWLIRGQFILVAISVAAANGYLYLFKSEGFLHMTITGTAQLKERS